jgi:uncharacterized membrane protein
MFDLGDIFTINFVLAALSIPFLWGLVPRNRFYGFRVPATLRDDHVWYTMNRRVAREMVPVGFVLAIVAVACGQFGVNTRLVRTLLSVVTLLALATIMIRGWVSANRLVRQKHSL